MKIGNTKVSHVLYYLYKILDTESIRKITKKNETDWFYNEILSNLSYSYEFNFKDGNSFVIDLEEDCDYLTLYKLFVKNKGLGLGSSVLDILKEYITKEKKYFSVVQVINPEFFSKFDWLEYDNINAFEVDMT